MKKTTVLIPIIALALTAASAARNDAAVLAGDDRTYAVEVVSTDMAGKTLVVRSGDSLSTFMVDDRILGSLRDVGPGDRITISVRDDFGRRRKVTAFVADSPRYTRYSYRYKRPARRTVIMRQPGTAVEFVNLDPPTRTITVLGDYGERQTFHVDDRAMLSLADVRPGQRVMLSYRFDINGRPEAVVRVVPTSRTLSLARLQSGAMVEVVSADPFERTLTIRGDSGESRTLLVDESALLDLRDLRFGDSVLVRTEDDRVVLISRRD